MFTKFSSYEILLKVNELINSEITDIKAMNKIRRCFTQIITNFGFFADLLFKLTIGEAHPNSGVDTMATDGKSIVYNAKFVNELSEEEIIFVLIHEVMHNANFHFDRMGIRNPRLWNVAADYAINIQIDDMRSELRTSLFSTPKNALLDQKYRGMNAEMIYDLLENELKDKNKDKGDGSDGSSEPSSDSMKKGGDPGTPGGTPQGDIREPGSLDGISTPVYQGDADLGEAKSKEDVKKQWKDIISNAAAKTAGTGSQSLDRWIRKANKPKINWRSELKKFIANVYDQLDYAYSNKRYIWQELHVPGAKEVDTSSFENAVIAIDTSGSINDDTLAKFGTEMLKLFKTYKIYDCTVIWCDSEIPANGVQKFKIADGSFKLDKLKPVGGGGTSFKPPFQWIQTNLLKKGKVPAFVIYFTDAYGVAPSVGEYGIRGYANRVLWVVTENDDASNLKFGKKIYIDKIVN